MCAYQGLRNVKENLAGFVFLKHPPWNLPFCLITNKVLNLINLSKLRTSAVQTTRLSIHETIISTVISVILFVRFYFDFDFAFFASSFLLFWSIRVTSYTSLVKQRIFVWPSCSFLFQTRLKGLFRLSFKVNCVTGMPAPLLSVCSILLLLILLFDFKSKLNCRNYDTNDVNIANKCDVKYYPTWNKLKYRYPKNPPK